MRVSFGERADNSKVFPVPTPSLALQASRSLSVIVLGLLLLLDLGCGTGDVPQEREACSPAVTTGKATALGTRAFSPNGTVYPEGRPTTYFFEYGTTPSYGLQAAPSYGGLQITPRTALARLENLQPATIYHYRIVAVSDKGTTQGDDATFETQATPRAGW